MLKPKESLMIADRRNDAVICDRITGERRPMRIEDLHDLVGNLDLKTTIPQEIREQFDVARNLFIYSWFDYSFVTLAEQHDHAVLEMALRERVRAAGGDPTKANGLHALHQMAAGLCCLRHEDFEMPSPINPG